MTSTDQPIVQSQPAQSPPPVPKTTAPQPQTPSQVSGKSVAQQISAAVAAGVEDGTADGVMGFIRTALHNLLMAPYDILKFSLTMFIITEKQKRKKFLWMSVVVSVLCIVAFGLQYIQNGEVKFLVQACMVPLAPAVALWLTNKDFTQVDIESPKDSPTTKPKNNTKQKPSKKQKESDPTTIYLQ